jgi:hypothetical protein
MQHLTGCTWIETLTKPVKLFKDIILEELFHFLQFLSKLAFNRFHLPMHHPACFVQLDTEVMIMTQFPPSASLHFACPCTSE